MNTSAALSDDQKIWRYMNHTKFLSMLTHGALYFAPLSQLDDPYEGFIPRRDVKASTDH